MTFVDECSSATMSGKSAFEVLSTSAPAKFSLSAVAEENEEGDDPANQGPEGYVVGMYGSGGKLDVIDDTTNYHRWTYSNEICSLGAPFYMYTGWNNTYEFELLHDMTDVLQGLVISQVPDSGELRDYIMNGKTEKIEFDNRYFNVISRDIVSMFLDVKYYIFYLKVAA